MRGSRPAALFVVGALVLLVVFAASGESAVPNNIAEPEIEPGLPGITFNQPDTPSLGMPSNWEIDPAMTGKVALGVVCLLLLLAVVLMVLKARQLGNRLGVGEVIESVEGTIDTVMRLRLKEAVEQARDVLARAGGEPADAVIRAWVTLENATSHRRAPHQTATEFTVALLEKETADEEALRELRTLYQRARFGGGSDERDVAAAVAALDRILATIR